ncbi:HAD family phosphatase [Aerococcaceae bacterium DSM 111022]|nr:HAD family phosphatase [Aerococcaceae bacterium DSM 111022]
MTLKLICIDLDETLLRTDKTYDVDRFKTVLKKLEDKGIMVTIVTGNAYQKVEHYFDQEELETLYFCCDNGNAIMKKGQRLHSFSLGPDTVKGVVRYLNDYPEYSPLASINDISYIGANRKDAYEAIQKYNPRLEVAESLDYIPLEDGVNKIAIYSSNEPLEKNKRLAKTITDKFEGVASVTSGDGWVDVYHKDGGKGAAVSYLQDKYGITFDETMAFGDSLNDASMMLKVKYSVSMSNADPDLVALTHYQIGSNKDQSVISLLEKLVEQKDLSFMEEYRIK